MGITLSLLAKRFIVIVGAGRIIWTLDRVEKILCCQVLSALTLEDVACHVFQESVWKNELSSAVLSLSGCRSVVDVWPSRVSRTEGIGRSIKCRVAVHGGIMYWYLSFQRGSLGTPRNLGRPLRWVVVGRVGVWGQLLGCPSQAEPSGVYFPWWTGTYMISLERPSRVTGKGGRLGVEAQCKVPLRP